MVHIINATAFKHFPLLAVSTFQDRNINQFPGHLSDAILMV